MSNNVKQHILVVDDEQRVREAIRQTLEEIDVEVTCFARATDCLEQLSFQKCDLLITDLKMPEMDGIELVKNVKRLMPWLPVMIITGYGDIPTAVKAIKAGALDFVEKPLHKETFLDKVEWALRRNDNQERSDRLLTRRERTVLGLVISGKSSKEIADLLSRSIRTIEVHRSHIMHKLGVHNLVDLAKQAVAKGLVGELDSHISRREN